MHSIFLFLMSLFVSIVQCTQHLPRQFPPPFSLSNPLDPASSSSSTTSSTPVSSPPASSSTPTTPTSSTPLSSAPSSPPPSAPTSDPALSSPSSSSPGSTQFVTDLVTATSPGSSSSSATSTAAPDNSNKSSPVGSGTIIGLSVAGGVAVLGIVAFVIWKLTRKRFSDFDADGEEIKWPELNNETHALPTNPTGRVGIDDDGYDEAPVGHYNRGPSPYGQAPSTAGASVADVNPYNDPYAVPPLPHLNPNQPYRDDPNAPSNYYDPYRGPVPQSLHDPYDGTESIPMSTYSTSSGSAALSSQNQGYFSGAQSPDQGRRSPGPNTAYGRQSPGPAVGYSGRQSPGPAIAYGGRQSPGPAAAYGDAANVH